MQGFHGRANNYLGEGTKHHRYRVKVTKKSQAIRNKSCNPYKKKTNKETLRINGLQQLHTLTRDLGVNVITIEMSSKVNAINPTTELSARNSNMKNMNFDLKDWCIEKNYVI